MINLSAWLEENVLEQLRAETPWKVANAVKRTDGVEAVVMVPKPVKDKS